MSVSDIKKLFDIEVEHLCSICEYTHKCIRFKSITEAISKIEENALDKWRLDVEITYGIKKCDLLKIDEEKIINIIKESIDELDEEDPFGGFDFRNRLLDFDEGDDF